MTSRTWGPDGSGIPISSANLNGIETDITAATNTANAAIPASQKGAASGVASLDASTKVPAAQLPAATASAAGAVQLAGDLAGTAAAPTVPGLASRVQIGGDLSGTATAPTVAKVNGVAVTGTAASGKVLTASSGTAAAWATPTGGRPIWAASSGTSSQQLVYPPGQPSVGTAPSYGHTYAMPILLRNGTITSISVQVATAATPAGATATLALYTESGGTWTRQATFGTIATDSTGVKTLTGSWAVTDGVWWLAIGASANQAAYYSSPLAWTGPIGGWSTDMALQYPVHGVQSFTASCPATFTPNTYADAQWARFQLAFTAS